MNARRLILASCALLLARAPTKSQTPVVPAGSPAPAAKRLSPKEVDAARKEYPFRQFTAWLDAVNSGDRNRLKAFLDANYPTASIAGQMDFRARTGGFDSRVLEEATPTNLVGLV